METKKIWSRLRHSFGAAMTALAAFKAVAVETNSVSLDDCIKMALQKNLDIRIAYYNPRQALSQLRQQYAAWDPTFGLSAEQRFRQQPGLALPGAAAIPGAETWSETYTAGITGNNSPLGTIYNIGFNVPRSSQEGVGINIYSPTLNLRLQQPLLRDFWIDQPRMMIAINKLGVKRSEQDVQELVITTTAQVALAYLDVIAARESVRVQRKAVETAERRLSEQKKRVEVGALAPLDEKQSEAEVYRAKADLIQAEGLFGNAQTALRTLINDDLASWDDVVLEPTLTLSAEPVAFDKKDSWHKALTLRPDVLRAGILLDQQKIRRRFTYNQLFPQLDLTGGYGLQGVAGQSPNQANPQGIQGHVGDALNQLAARDLPNHYAGVVFSIPLSNRNAREAHKQAKLEQDRLLLDYKRVEQNAMRAIDVSIRAAKTQFERVGATRKQREFAAQALDAEEKKLANGKSTAFQVLELQRQLTQSESDEINAFSEYNKELYRLSQAEGDILNKLGILLDYR